VPDLIYRVTTSNSNGTRYCSDSTGTTPQALADQVAADTRSVRPDMTDMDALLTIHVWSARDNEHYRLPVPDDADRFDYPSA
jgi:hypothetical protein